MSPQPEWLLISDVDGTLTGDDAALSELMRMLRASPHIGFGVATGRSLDLVLAAVEEFALLEPDPIIASVGSEIYGGERLGV